MKISELIAAVGDENVRFQNLLNDAQSIDKTKHGTKITFYTDGVQAEELMNGGHSTNIGLVLWLPRDRVNAVMGVPGTLAGLKRARSAPPPVSS